MPGGASKEDPRWTTDRDGNLEGKQALETLGVGREHHDAGRRKQPVDQPCEGRLGFAEEVGRGRGRESRGFDLADMGARDGGILDDALPLLFGREVPRIDPFERGEGFGLCPDESKVGPVAAHGRPPSGS